MGLKERQRWAVVIALLICSAAAFVAAQQPQNNAAPPYRVNAQWVNGVAPGYAPTKGAGLTLNIGPGTTNCFATIVEYAGGTRSMTNNTTNYVFLDTTSSCAPSSNTSGFTGSTIPLHKVVTSGGVITSIDDVRNSFTTPVGTGSVTGGSCTNQYAYAINSVGVPSCISFADVKIIPAANCGNGSAGIGWSYAAGQFTANCRAGTNNLGGWLQAIPSTGAIAQFNFDLPGDWDTAQQPFIRINYGSGSNTSGTVINTVASACVDNSTPGGSSDDPSFNAESAFSTQTMANANREWYIAGQFTQATSGNGCKPFSTMLVKITLSGTASANIGYYKAVMTTPRKVQIQAN